MSRKLAAPPAAQILHTTSGAANAVPCPPAFILYCIKHAVITPIRDSNGRSLLTQDMIDRVREYRARRRA
jgi:hypothetical protein